MQKNNNHLVRTISALAAARLFNNMSRRFAYPFIPAIGRALGVSTGSIQGAMATQAGVGIISPIFGPLSELYGRKRVLLLAMALMGLGAVPGIVAPTYGVFYVVMILFGLSKIIFDPAMQAYIGDLVPYHYRGRAIGSTELAWAGSLIVAAPLTGFLLDKMGLSAVFVMLFIASTAGFGLIWYYVPSDKPDKTAQVPNFFEGLKIIRNSPVATAALIYTLLFITANELVTISFARWMETTFDLKLTALGTSAVVIALAEVTGEFMVIGLADRLGKKRLTLFGVLGAALMYLTLTRLSSLTAALVGLFLVYLFVETAIVSSIPLFTEILPSARAVMMSASVAGHSIARFTGGLMGIQIYNWGNFDAIGAVAAALCLTALIVMWGSIHENHSSSTIGAT